MEKKSIAALIVTGAMVLGLSACGTNGAASDNTGNSQSTSAPVVTEPADTSTPEPVSTTEPEDTQEPAPTHVSYTITDATEVEGLEALFEEAFQKYNEGAERVTLDTLASEQAYVKENGNKVFGEGETLPSNIDDVYLAWRNTNHPVTPEPERNEGSGTGSPSSSGEVTKPSTGKPSNKPSGQSNKPSSKPSGQTSKPADQGSSGSTDQSYEDTLKESTDKLKEIFGEGQNDDHTDEDKQSIIDSIIVN